LLIARVDAGVSRAEDGQGKHDHETTDPVCGKVD
jgi:hypothetical protein